MKKSFILTVLLLSVWNVFGQSKLDVQSHLSLMKQRNSLPAFENQHKSLPQFDETQVKSHQIGMIIMQGDSAKTQLEAEGVRVLRTRGDIAIVAIPTADVERISELKCVRKVQLARKLQQKMDKVREAIGVNKIHEGLDLPQAYTGKGVVTGICDSGLDPNHINFRDADGKCRFGYIGKINESSSTADGYVYNNYYPEDKMPSEGTNIFPISEFKTDSKTTYHGTHTTGIMAGGYKGEVMAAVSSADQETSTNQTITNPYYGCATESEIVASCGDLYDAFIAMGIEDCINYAKLSNGVDEAGNPIKKKPLVINLSLNSTLGSHDTKSTMNQYLALAGKEAIICVSAGNEGDIPLALQKKCVDNDTVLQSFVKPIYTTYTQSSKTYYNLRYGNIYVYNSDATPMEIQMVIYNKKRGSVAYRMAVSSSTDGDAVTWSSGGDYSIDGATESATFKKAFDGYVAIGTMPDSETGRYYGVIEYFLSDNQTNNADGNYILGIVVKDKAGKRINAYCDGNWTYFDGYGKNGWVDGETDGTIGDMGVANNILCVGSYNTKDHWPAIDGYVYGYNDNEYPAGEVTGFSSYGTLTDGTTRPHVCAPGASVISSANKYCVENSSMGYTDAAISAKLIESDRTDYWQQSLGTSMACPVVAGSIALWLEADPTLTIAEVQDIVKKTATVDWDVRRDLPSKWGAGKFNAYAGLKEVLRRKATAINCINTDADDNRPVITSYGNHGLRVFKAGASTMRVNIYNMSGQKLNTVSATGDEVTVEDGLLRNGIYMVQVNGGKAVKIVVE